MASKMRKRPSEVLFIRDELTAWSFDRAVLSFAAHVERQVDLRTRGAKTQQDAERIARDVLDKYLYIDEPRPTQGRYRDPAVERRR